MATLVSPPASAPYPRKNWARPSPGPHEAVLSPYSTIRRALCTGLSSSTAHNADRPRTEQGLIARARLAQRSMTGTVSRAGKLRAQRLALEQLGDEVGAAVAGADVMDDEDVGVVEPGCGARISYGPRRVPGGRVM
jgi:hypothetical protein